MKLYILASFSGQGGVEKMLWKLLREFSKQPGFSITLVVIRSDSLALYPVPENIKVVKLPFRYSTLNLLSLALLLRKSHPDVLLAAKDRAGRLALKARRLSGINFPIFIRIGTTLSAAMQKKSRMQQWLRYRPIRKWYPKADGFIAVSNGVRNDIIQLSAVDPSKVHVVRNPVIDPEIFDKSLLPVNHRWINDKSLSVILGVGRLTAQKDFPTLLRAFALIQKSAPHTRLVILGEGAMKDQLLQLANELDIESFIDLPGFIRNPYPWIQQASLFILSSQWEGSPNSLTEAMALGTPVVSTDCPSGPSELLSAGKIAPLVDIGDYASLARAALKLLSDKPEATQLREAVKAYTSEASAKHYLNVISNR
jgi:glycosyltransferase involved in cell wall biosynthesis